MDGVLVVYKEKGMTSFDVVNKISKIQKEGRKEIKEKGFPVEENAIKNVAIFLPSYTMADKAFYLPNIRNKEDKPLKYQRNGSHLFGFQRFDVEISFGTDLTRMNDLVSSMIDNYEYIFDDIRKEFMEKFPVPVHFRFYQRICIKYSLSRYTAYTGADHECADPFQAGRAFRPQYTDSSENAPYGIGNLQPFHSGGQPGRDCL